MAAETLLAYTPRLSVAAPSAINEPTRFLAKATGQALPRGASLYSQAFNRRRPLCIAASAGISALLLSAAASKRLHSSSLAFLSSKLPRSRALASPIGTQRLPEASSTFTTAAMANVSIGTPAAKTITVPAAGQHKATVVFMHGLGDTGEGWADVPVMLKLPGVKWIFPSAPIQPVTVNMGFPCPSWFDIFGLTADSKEDSAGIDRAARYIGGILEAEKKNSPGVKIIVGGFSQGGALSLHLTSRKFAGTFLDGADASNVPLDGTICLSGWLPAADKVAVLKNPEGAGKYSVLCCHGEEDTLVRFSFGQRSAEALKSLGFSSLQFKSYRGLPHSACPEELQDVKAWIEALL